MNFWPRGDFLPGREPRLTSHAPSETSRGHNGNMDILTATKSHLLTKLADDSRTLQRNLRICKMQTYHVGHNITNKPPNQHNTTK